MFTIEGVDLKNIENFKYLGRQTCNINLDSQALFMNLCKVSKLLNHLFVLITREGADPVVRRQLYIVAVVISVLLYGFRDLGVEPYYS